MNMNNTHWPFIPSVKPSSSLTTGTCNYIHAHNVLFFCITTKYPAKQIVSQITQLTSYTQKLSYFCFVILVKKIDILIYVDVDDYDRHHHHKVIML